MKIIKKIFVLFLLFSLNALLFASGKNLGNNLTEYKLENGLTVFVAENHSVPLAYIEIAVKAGAVTQTKETAGLFHLYEHMMFKGNSRFPDSASVQKAISDLGVSEWNGTTGLECVNYYFTVPSTELRRGLEFWNYAIREPLLDENELEVEKKVVLSEIQAEFSAPEKIYHAYIDKVMFPAAPWQLDAGGSEEVVRRCKREDLISIKEKYYVPDNAALFVGGDVIPEEVLKLANEIFGSWKRGSGNYSDEVVNQGRNFSGRTLYFVMPFEKISPQVAQISVRFRGPDCDLNRGDTYTADMLNYFFANPLSPYSKRLAGNQELGIPSDDYVWSGYATKRQTGIINFGCMMLSPEQNLPSRVRLFYKTVQDDICGELSDSKKIIPPEQRKLLLQRMKDDRVIDSETAGGLLSTVRFWWITADTDYYVTNIEKIKAVKDKDISEFIKKYIVGQNAIVTVLVNPELYVRTKDEFEKEGFVEIKSQDAFWWNEGEAK